MMASQVKAMSNANKAATMARKKLIDAHTDEYNQYLREARTSLGLPADPNEAKLIARREKLQRQLEEINNQLA